MNYETKTKQGHKIIARGYSGNYGLIILAERNYGEKKNYVVATGYSETYGDWNQGHYLTNFKNALQTFINYTWYIHKINYKEE